MSILHQLSVYLRLEYSYLTICPCVSQPSVRPTLHSHSPCPTCDFCLFCFVTRCSSDCSVQKRLVEKMASLSGSGADSACVSHSAYVMDFAEHGASLPLRFSLIRDPIDRILARSVIQNAGPSVIVTVLFISRSVFWDHEERHRLAIIMFGIGVAIVSAKYNPKDESVLIWSQQRVTNFTRMVWVHRCVMHTKRTFFLGRNKLNGIALQIQEGRYGAVQCRLRR